MNSTARYCILLILVCYFLPAVGQDNYSVSGKVVDNTTKLSLAFVNIIINQDAFAGGTTDIDGKFRLHYPEKINSLTLSHVGYEQLTFPISTKYQNLLIFMTQTEVELKEVEILPGINPAHRIIQHAIDNRDTNDPEKLRSFSYTSYDKTIFTVENDTSIDRDFKKDTANKMSGDATIGITFTTPPVKKDSLEQDSVKGDTTDLFLSKMITRQYLFLMENVTKRKFLYPDNNYNQVIASKMSGFKDPIFVFLTTQIQSFSFYKPFITIFQKAYVNPISRGSPSKYFFKLEDTTFAGKDTVFIIKFRPRKGTNFDGLKGVISINSNKWGIQNVIAEPYDNAEGFNIRIQQLYELMEGDHWFPVQLNTDVAFNNLRVGKYRAIGSGRSYIRDIILNPEMVRGEFNHLDIEVDKNATSRKEEFWNQYRVDSLTAKDRKTYQVIDSIGKANNFDRLAKSLQTLMSGKIPWKIFDFDVSKIFNYSTYQGVVLGIGIHTNDRLLNWFKIGGYYQYGFAIYSQQYGGDFRFLLSRRNDVSIQASYFNDLLESGGVQFFDGPESVLKGNWQPWLIKKMDWTQNLSLSTTFRLRKYFLMNVGVSHSYKKSTTYDLATTVDSNTTLYYDSFHFCEVSAGVKWAYGEKFIQTADNKISLGTNYPVVWFQYSRGIKGFWNSQFEYNRFDLRIRKSFLLRYFGKFTFQVNAGYVDQPIPATNIYYGIASYRLFTIYAPNSFGTMRMNEFLDNKYLAIFLYHDFGKLLYKGKKWFHPEPALIQNVGFGWLDHPEVYSEIVIKPKAMDLGYYETGLLINNLVNLKLYNIGIGVSYRWGPYSLEYPGDNFAGKVSVIFPFGN
jgi:hypothetical protein